MSRSRRRPTSQPAQSRGWAAVAAASVTVTGAAMMTTNGVSAPVLAPFALLGLAIAATVFAVLVLLVVVLIPDPRGRPA